MVRLACNLSRASPLTRGGVNDPPLVLVDARIPAEVVVAHPTPAAVIKDGNVASHGTA
jgi:hypothetical protein